MTWGLKLRVYGCLQALKLSSGVIVELQVAFARVSITSIIVIVMLNLHGPTNPGLIVKAADPITF